MILAESQGEIHDIFVSWIEMLRVAAETNAQAALLLEKRVWVVPDSSFGWAGDPHDVVDMTAAFDRGLINQNYVDVLNNRPPGTVGDQASLRVQNEYVAGLERAFRARHSSAIRSLIHGAARRQGHGDEIGIYKAVEAKAKELLARGVEAT